MSGIEVIGLVAAVLSAIRILPEIPRVYRRVFPGRENRSSSKAVQDGRNTVKSSSTASRTYTSQEVEIRRSDNQLVVTSETMRTVRKIHDNQTLVQLSNNQLQAITSNNSTRAYEISLETLKDFTMVANRRAEHQWTTSICCMVVVVYLAYLLGMARAENESLKAVVVSRLDSAMPIKVSDSASSSWNSLQWSVLTDRITIWMARIRIQRWVQLAFSWKIVCALLWSMFSLAFGLQLLALFYANTAAGRLGAQIFWFWPSILVGRIGVILLVHGFRWWLVALIPLDVIWLRYVQRRTAAAENSNVEKAIN